MKAQEPYKYQMRFHEFVWLSFEQRNEYLGVQAKYSALRKKELRKKKLTIT